jgi:uncharacterized protein (UPF0332 family)
VFDWQEYLILAKALASKSDPASLRSAVSRAYYFAYNRAVSLALKKNLPRDPKLGLHAGMWEAFRTVSYEVFSDGNRLRRARNDADYDARLSISRRDAEIAIIRAQKLAELLQGI